MLPLEYWTHFKTFLCTSMYTWQRRKNVSIANDSMVRQYPMDHRHSWVWRPPWGWRASSVSKLKDGCVCAWWLDVQIEYVSQSRCIATLLTHQKRWVYLIALRRWWDDPMSLCGVLNGSSNVRECWYRRSTLWLAHIPSGNVAARVLNTFQNVSLYFDVHLTQKKNR